MYPGTSNKPQGKLRLLYECNPMAFIVEQAGGVASDGFNRILDIVPTELHQRTSIFIGSPKMVKMAEDLMAEFSPKSNMKQQNSNEKLAELGVVGGID